jgi:very-short-patch-repair endonuclease
MIRKIAKSVLKTPLNLPNGETSDTGSNQDSENYSPPLEGLGEVKSNEDSIPGYITANPYSYLYIREIRDALKNNPTKEEKLMWNFLKNKKVGYKIRRQHIIGDFITDFVCLQKRVVIEIDGKIHLYNKENDLKRTLLLNEMGYDVIHFNNLEVSEEPGLVAFKIKEYLDNKVDFSTELDTEIS